MICFKLNKSLSANISKWGPQKRSLFERGTHVKHVLEFWYFQTFLFKRRKKTPWIFSHVLVTVQNTGWEKTRHSQAASALIWSSIRWYFSHSLWQVSHTYVFARLDKMLSHFFCLKHRIVKRRLKGHVNILFHFWHFLPPNIFFRQFYFFLLFFAKKIPKNVWENIFSNKVLSQRKAQLKHTMRKINNMKFLKNHITI